MKCPCLKHLKKWILVAKVKNGRLTSVGTDVEKVG